MESQARLQRCWNRDPQTSVLYKRLDLGEVFRATSGKAAQYIGKCLGGEDIFFAVKWVVLVI